QWCGPTGRCSVTSRMGKKGCWLPTSTSLRLQAFLRRAANPDRRGWIGDGRRCKAIPRESISREDNARGAEARFVLQRARRHSAEVREIVSRCLAAVLPADDCGLLRVR